MITEAISMYNELDLLEAHLEESQHWADRIVIIESPVTFASVSKPLFFEENKERFARFNVDYLVTPPDAFEQIPYNYPEEDKRKWFQARRNNRNLNRQFHWDELRRDTDYVYLNDVDEFISSEHWHHLGPLLENNHYHYIAIKTRKFNYFINSRGSKQEQYRITRADKPEFVMQRGTPRIATKEMGWHFTNCFSPEEIRNKLYGICCHMGRPPSWVPSVEKIAEDLSNLIEPAVGTNMENSFVELMPRGDMSWAPKFMRENPDLFPWLDIEHTSLHPGWRLK